MKKINKLCIRRFEIVRVKKMTKKHYEVVAAVIMKNETIFCCQRGNKGECAYKWEFPGGKIESGETKEEALIREIKEDRNVTELQEQFYKEAENPLDTKQ